MAKDTGTKAAVTTTPDGFAEGRKLSAGARGAKLPDFRDRTRPVFLAAHYSSWELVKIGDAWRLVPVLKPLFVQPGFWTKTAKKNETPDPSLLLAKGERMNFVVLRRNEDYCYELDGVNGSKGIFLNWEKVRLYEDGMYEVVVDRQAGYAFRWDLVVSGTVKPPREGVLAEMRQRLVRQRQRATRTPHLAVAQQALAEADERLKGLDEAIAALKPKAAA